MQINIRSKKDLEIFLQKLKKVESYKYSLEQYPTDASLASEILFLAYLDGNIEDKVVGDFGAGNGIFSVGASLIGARKVYAVEMDPDQCEMIRLNSAGLNIEVFQGNINDFSQKVDTVVMNPPFGSVNEGADRIFLQKAVALSNHIYSLHNFKSADFVRNFYTKNAEMVPTNRVTEHLMKDCEATTSNIISDM